MSVGKHVHVITSRLATANRSHVNICHKKIVQAGGMVDLVTFSPSSVQCLENIFETILMLFAKSYQN